MTSKYFKIKVTTMVGKKTEELKTCRVCLKEGNFCFPIYDGYVDLSAVLYIFGNIIVKPDDAYPKYLCQGCHNDLQSAVLFRKRAQRSDAMLRKSTKHIATVVNIKEEVPSADDADADVQTTSAIKADTKFDIKQKTNIVSESLDRSKKRYGLFNESATEHNKQVKLKHEDPITVHGDATTNLDTKSNIIELEVPPIPISNHNSNDNAHLKCVTATQKMRKGPLSCFKCNLHFNSATEYLQHTKTDEHKKQVQSIQKEKQETHICDVCGKTFRLKSTLVTHRMTHTSDLVHKCSLCPYKGRTPYAVKKHMLSHTGEKSHACPHCPAKFTHSCNLARHVRSHSDSKGFKCDQCPRDFYYKPQLEQHIRSIHLGIHDFECNICNKRFGTKKQLRKHQRKVHKVKKVIAGRTPLYLLPEKEICK